VPIVHAVTNDEVVERPDFIDVACAVMRALGPRGAIHLRAPRASAARLFALAQGLSVAQRLTGAWLVVNDRIDVALTVGARGAQLTSRSLLVDDARRAAPHLALGASVHGVDDGCAAAAAGAAWLVAGQIFAPASGTDPLGRGMPFVEALVAAATVPVIAIGGLLPSHGRALRMAGVYGVAVIRGIWDAPNAERAASDYLPRMTTGEPHESSAPRPTLSRRPWAR
jgi:thiazole tautomerase (transcriptional regulator TenI)